MTKTKKELAEWLRDKTNNHGMSVWFTPKVTSEAAYNRFMKLSKGELSHLIENGFDDGVDFLESL